MANTAEIVIGLLFITTGLLNHVQSQSQYDVRLADGDQYNNGRVEIYYNDEWVTVCDINWGDDDAQLVCRQLGYDSGNARHFAYYGPGSGSIFNLDCSFSGSNLSACSFVEASSYSCDHYDDAGVQCGDGTTTASSFFPSTSIRLVGGASAREGRVEIYYNGEWGTVCDDFWDDNDAEVVCRQLGLSTDSAVAWTSTGSYGQGTGRILLDNVDCYGYEYSLTACAFNGWYNNHCGHYRDAGVRCGSRTSPITSPRVIGTMSFVGISLFLLLVIGIVVVCRVCNTKPNPTHIVSHGTELTPINNGSTTTNQYTASPSAVTQGTPISSLPPPATAPSTVTVLLPPGTSSQSQAPVNPTLSLGAHNPETGQSQLPEEHEYLEVNPGIPPPDSANTYQDLDLTHQETSYQDLNQFPEDNDYLEPI